MVWRGAFQAVIGLETGQSRGSRQTVIEGRECQTTAVRVRQAVIEGQYIWSGHPLHRSGVNQMAGLQRSVRQSHSWRRIYRCEHAAKFVARVFVLHLAKQLGTVWKRKEWMNREAVPGSETPEPMIASCELECALRWATVARQSIPAKGEPLWFRHSVHSGMRRLVVITSVVHPLGENETETY